MKKKRGLIYGCLCLAALCVIYTGVGQVQKVSLKKAELKEEQEKIYMTDFTDITALSYDYKGQELSFIKAGDTWKLEKDEAFPVNQDSINALANVVSKLEAVRKLENGDDLSAYGLTEPVRRISITGDNGKIFVIALGGTTESGDYYALVEGQTEPCLINSVLFDETDKGLEDWMALEEFPQVTGSDIQKITITEGGKKREYVKKKLDDEAGTIEWYRDDISQPENKLENNSQLNVLADSLSSLTVTGCANYKAKEEDLAGYGLYEPYAVISYTYEKNGEEDTFLLNVGSLNEDQTCYYTRTENSFRVNEIEKAAIDKCLTVEEEAQTAE